LKTTSNNNFASVLSREMSTHIKQIRVQHGEG